MSFGSMRTDHAPYNLPTSTLRSLKDLVPWDGRLRAWADIYTDYMSDMAHQRTGSNVEGVKEPHSVSLKVLRLSRPTLPFQFPLPTPAKGNEGSYPSPAASLAFPREETDAFILSPLLTLPPAFGSAYVGETFSCTLCANNELPPSPSSTPGLSPAGKTITNVRIEAEMKIPSSAIPIVLSFSPSSDENEDADTSDNPKVPDEGVDLARGESLQRIVSFMLKEEGSHVLAVTVTYTEKTPTSGRVRTFRKLYQFVCKGCMVVRTKTGLLAPSPASLKKKGGQGRRWALEAQLENTSEEILTLEKVVLDCREGLGCVGLNWDDGGEGDVERPVLMPGDVQQVAFVVWEVEGKKAEEIDGRVGFGSISMAWRGPMGNRGVLSTGGLSAKVR